MSPDSSASKTCTQCGAIYPATTTHFKPDKHQSSGLRPECRQCSRQRFNAWYAKNQAEQAAKRRARYAAKPAQYLATNRASEARNPDQARLNKRLSAQRRPRDLVLSRLKNLRRAARKQNLPDSFTAADWARALHYFGHACAVCGRREGPFVVLAADHWVALRDPRPDNPGTVPANIVPLCHALKGVPADVLCCNNSKRSADPVAWLTRRFGPEQATLINVRIAGFFEMVRNGEK